MQRRSKKKKPPRRTGSIKYKKITIEARQKAHDLFDPLWQKKETHYRDTLYKWLASQMGLKPKKCHFSKFSARKCFQAIKIIKLAIRKGTIPQPRKVVYSMKQRTFYLCVCGHRRRMHSGGKCEDCHGVCIFKEGNMPNVIPQKIKEKELLVAAAQRDSA